MLVVRVGRAEETAIVLLTVSASDTSSSVRRPHPQADARLYGIARQLDAVLVETVQDLGLTLDVSRRVGTDGAWTDERLIEAAKTSWVFSPRIYAEGSRLVVRVVAVAPGSRVVLTRSEVVAPEDLEVRAMVMMRDLVRLGGGKRATELETPAPPTQGAVVYAARSRGRAVLALNSAAFGGYAGFALQRAGGSEDARLTYPLIALGTGLGLGSSIIVADEWDVGVGDAWYLAAGMWWPTLSGFLLATSYDEPERYRYLYGLAGGLIGVGLATTALTFGGMPDGGAVLAHSGGAFGTAFGGLAQLIYEGTTDVTPTRGMGYGAGAGVLIAGAVARMLPTLPSSRLLLVDLAAALGGLTGAAVASPLVFGEESKNKNRLWLGSIATGLIVGGTAGLFFTRSSADENENPKAAQFVPYFATIPKGGAIIGVASQW